MMPYVDTVDEPVVEYGASLDPTEGTSFEENADLGPVLDEFEVSSK